MELTTSARDYLPGRVEPSPEAPLRAISSWLPSMQDAEAEWKRMCALSKSHPLVKLGLLVIGIAILTAMVGGVGYAVFQLVTGLLSGRTDAVIVLIGLGTYMGHVWFRACRWRTDRADDTLEIFAAAFDLRSVDPWVVRAVWEAAEGWGNGHIRRADDLWNSVFDPDDDWDIVPVIVLRCMRRVEDYEDHVNQRREPIETVGDLVNVISRLPRHDTMKR